MGGEDSGLGGGAILGFYAAIKICIRDGYDPIDVMQIVLGHVMSIDAIVETVYHNEDGSGRLGLTGDDRGQSNLYFDTAPHDVTALNGRHIWGGSESILCGEVKLANRIGYTKIAFVVESVSAAIAEGDRKRQERKDTG